MYTILVGLREGGRKLEEQEHATPEQHLATSYPLSLRLHYIHFFPYIHFSRLISLSHLIFFYLILSYYIILSCPSPLTFTSASTIVFRLIFRYLISSYLTNCIFSNPIRA